MDRKALIGLLSGVALVIATMVGVAVVNTRAAEGADTQVAGRTCAATGYGDPVASEACPRAN